MEGGLVVVGVSGGGRGGGRVAKVQRGMKSVSPPPHPAPPFSLFSSQPFYKSNFGGIQLFVWR